MLLDLIVIGNGAIGCMAALKLQRQFPSKKIGLFGNKKRFNSASTAAGAMCNVVAEYEHSYSNNMKILQEINLELGIKGQHGWRKFLKESNIYNKVVTADNTLVFLKQNASNFELRNFLAVKQLAVENNSYLACDTKKIDEFFSNVKIKPQEMFIIKHEFALDTTELFYELDKSLKNSGVIIVDENVNSINIENRQVITEKESFDYHMLVIAAGSESFKILEIPLNIELVQGVGSAYELLKCKSDAYFLNAKTVIRSVNRGGAQCGIHFVPRKSGYYLGAGNYISAIGDSEHRLETLRYLFSTFETELSGKEISYTVQGRIVKGHRPKSLDSFPIIGPLASNPEIFVATGTNRAGLTWAPAIGDLVTQWASAGDIVETNQYISPNRELQSFGTREEALAYYVESRMAAAVEHGVLQVDEMSKESARSDFLLTAQKLLCEVNAKIKTPDIILHPDHWGVYLEIQQNCLT